MNDKELRKKLDKLNEAIAKFTDSVPDLDEKYHEVCELIIDYLQHRLRTDGALRYEFFPGTDVLYLQFTEPYYGKIYNLSGTNGNGYNKVYGIFCFTNNDTIFLHADYYLPERPKDEKIEIPDTLREVVEATHNCGKFFALSFLFSGLFEIGCFSRQGLINLLNIVTEKNMDQYLAPSNIKLEVTFWDFLATMDKARKNEGI